MEKKLRIILGILLLFVSIGALPVGYSMIVNSSGITLGMSTDMLKNSIFPDYFVPGMVLFIVNGIFNLGAAFLCFFRSRYAFQSALILGIFMMLWIVMQIISIGLSSFLQALFFSIGLIETVISFYLIKRKQ